MLSERRQSLVLPAIETDKGFVERWNAVSYQGKGFPEDYPEHLTDRGERVRSKSEVIIANLLLKEDIPYRYEYPIRLRGIGRVYPDFTVLNVRIRKEFRWEHLGMMDDPDYANKAVRKIRDYQQNGMFPGDSLIITSETRTNPINLRDLKRVIDFYLK